MTLISLIRVHDKRRLKRKSPRTKRSSTMYNGIKGMRYIVGIRKKGVNEHLRLLQNERIASSFILDGHYFLCTLAQVRILTIARSNDSV